MIINVAPQASIATTPNPSFQKEGTTLGVRPCRSGRHGGLPLQLQRIHMGELKIMNHETAKRKR